MRVVFFSEARRIYLAFTETFLTTFCTQKRMVPRETQIRTIKFLFASSSTLCILLSFPHYSKCFFVVLLVALQFYYPSEKEATSYTFLSRVAGQTTRRIARELHVQSTHHQSGTIDTRESSRKFRLNHHHGTFNALLSSSIGAFYVRFDPPTTAPSGALEKCAKNDDDDDAK